MTCIVHSSFLNANEHRTKFGEKKIMKSSEFMLLAKDRCSAHMTFVAAHPSNIVCTKNPPPLIVVVSLASTSSSTCNKYSLSLQKSNFNNNNSKVGYHTINFYFHNAIISSNCFFRL